MPSPQPPSTSSTSEWGEYSQFILNELRRLAASQDSLMNAVQIVSIQMAGLEGEYKSLSKLDERVVALTNEVTALKVKAGIWGATAGLVAGLGLLFFYHL